MLWFYGVLHAGQFLGRILEFPAPCDDKTLGIQQRLQEVTEPRQEVVQHITPSYHNMSF